MTNHIRNHPVAHGPSPDAGGLTDTASSHPGHVPGDATSGPWVPVAEWLAGPNWGSHLLPRIGAEILVEFAHPHSRCAYPNSPTDFCDSTHRSAYARALEDAPANFANGLIRLDIPTRPEYHQKSLVVLEPDTGVVWPFPFDAYAGSPDTDGNPISEGTLEFSSDSSTACIGGSLLVYRALKAGRFCFTYDSGRLEGHSTQYSQAPDE